MRPPTAVEVVRVIAIAAILGAGPGVLGATAQTRDLGNGFMDHGPFADVLVSRGLVSTSDGDGNDVVVALVRASGLAEAVVIDARTGEVDQIPFPGRADWPFSSLLSSRGLYYTYTGGHFMEFDPAVRDFSYVEQGPNRCSMSMTEDDDGVIWSALYPDAHVLSFNPDTRELRNYGVVSEHDALQYPRSIAADDLGWIYVRIAGTVGQIFMLNPETAEVRHAVPEDQVVGGGGLHVYRDLNGKVYGQLEYGDRGRTWFELYNGEATIIDAPPEPNRKPIIAGGQGLRHYDLPGGERITDLDLVEGVMSIEDPETGATREVRFELAGGGSSLMQLAVAQNGTISGGTYHPKRVFSYDPRTDEWDRREGYGQWNTVVTTEDRFYIASYTEGVLLEWDPTREWVPTEIGNPDSNPRYLEQTVGQPHVGRPYAMLAHPDGRHIIYGGTPHYHHTGGGLVIYDIETETAEIITHEDLVPLHSQSSLVTLPDGRIVGATSIEPAMGGVQMAEVAELFIFDMESRTLEWRAPLIDGVERYNDMIVGPDGMIFGIADRTLLFVFDPQERESVHTADLSEDLGRAVHQQGPRIFIEVPDGRIFALFQAGIAQLNPETYELAMVAEAPVRLGNGGAYFEGRLYFAGGANLFSWQVPPAE